MSHIYKLNFNTPLQVKHSACTSRLPKAFSLAAAVAHRLVHRLELGSAGQHGVAQGSTWQYRAA